MNKKAFQNVYQIGMMFALLPNMGMTLSVSNHYFDTSKYSIGQTNRLTIKSMAVGAVSSIAFPISTPILYYLDSGERSYITYSDIGKKE